MRPGASIGIAFRLLTALSRVPPKASSLALALILLSLTIHVSAAPPTPTVRGETTVKSVTGHFVAGDRNSQIVVWSRRKDGLNILRAYERERGGWRVLAQGIHHRIVDLQVGDVENRGVDDIVLGLVQRSKLDIRERLRLYVYAVDPRRGFVPKWRGSGLSRPFRGFVLLPNPHGCDIIGLEKNTLPEYADFDWLGVYRWNGFGVRRIWETPVRGHIVAVKPVGNGAFRLTRELSDTKMDLLLFPVLKADGEIEYTAKVDGK